MNRPLLITDCDEVLLHMVVPFRDWVDQEHDVHFDLEQSSFLDALRRKACGTILKQDHVWELLTQFFDTEMHRQMPIDGALGALQRISQIADIVILTNITERAHQNRVNQLHALGLSFPVFWNQGGKGRPLAQIIADRKPTVAVFVDDLPQHHDSVERHAPDVWRLHMVGEPLLWPHALPAPRAHNRIDRWEEAERWICARFMEGAAPALAPSDNGS